MSIFNQPLNQNPPYQRRKDNYSSSDYDSGDIDWDDDNDDNDDDNDDGDGGD